MENAQNQSPEKETPAKMVMTTNEVVNVLGENYRTVSKTLDTMATMGDIEVTEKFVNNRALKGYILSTSDLQKIKAQFQKKRHFENEENATNIQMVANAINTMENAENKNTNMENANIKFFEVVTENAELKKEVEKLKNDIKDKTNENVRLDADLTVAKSELKFIEDKSHTLEGAYAEKKLEVEKLQNTIKRKNTALIVLGAVLLTLLTVIGTVFLIRFFNI